MKSQKRDQNLAKQRQFFSRFISLPFDDQSVEHLIADTNYRFPSFPKSSNVNE